ncbi:MAG: hypothetical protein LC624_05935, partial [Halobacteriales archaeon]|nr:hypothetical protein [Halobacteriales archaeon]
MQKMIGALLLTGMFLVSAMPAQAAAPSVGGMMALLDSTGKITVKPTSGLDAFQTCEGDAPLVNSCTLSDYTDPNFPSWTFGWNLPNGGFAGTPISTVEMSTEAVLTGSNGGSYGFGCDWGAGAAGIPWSAANIRCGILSFNGILPGGSLTYKTHAGLFSPSIINTALPDTNSVEAGVGHWIGLL